MMTPTNLSTRVRDLQASPIREILAVVDHPGMVSFAGGLPDSESFPTMEAGTIPRHFLQYGPSEGEPALREEVSVQLRQLGLRCDPSQVLILSGSQQGIDLTAKLLIDAGTSVAVESPTYLAALQVFRFFGARFVSLEAESVNATMLRRQEVRLAYVIPTFQNPTGHCYTEAERERLARACMDSGTVLFEDDPYRDLVYDACERRPVCAYMNAGAWIYQGSFSKSLAPGLRLGYLAASPQLLPWLTRLKQAADLHSSRLSQWLVLQQLRHPGQAERLTALADTYRGKRDAFDAALHAHLGGRALWHKPAGGLFFWLKLRQPRDTRALLPAAIQRQVAYMPGEAFFPDPESGLGTLRLNFTHASADGVHQGLRTLADLLEH